MEWNGYSECCRKAALNPAASFCTTCRTPLMRCMNFADCLQLVEPTKPCPVCIKPELVIEAGTTVSGGIGARLSLPLKLRNFNRQIRRPIYLKALVKNESGKGHQSVDLNWEIVEPATERTFYVEAGPFDADGVTRVELLLTIAMRSKEGYEEAYLFSGSLLLSITRDSNQQVIQNIDLSGAHFETGGLVHTKLDANQSGQEIGATDERQVVELERVEVAELAAGVRGYKPSETRVPRSVAFRFVGFPEADAPDWDVMLGARGALCFGRSSREAHPQNNPAPMDVSLRAYARDGTLDRDASTRVSRHHFDLLVLNERLMLHARSGKGALLNSQEVRSGAVVPIADGDIIAPARDVENAIRMRTRFRAGQFGRVEEIELIRES